MKGRFLIIILCALLAGAASAAQPTSRQIVAGVQERYAKIADIKAHFEQVTTLPRGRELKAAGEAYFKKPNMIRWDFQSPEAQSIITDGKTMWLYEPAEKQVQVYGAQMLGTRLRMGFFSDLRRLEEDFVLSAGQPTERYHVLELEPKEGRGLDARHLTLFISREPMRVVEAKITDLAGNDTVVKFSQIMENTALPESLFTFSPPEGVRVIRPPTQGPRF